MKKEWLMYTALVKFLKDALGERYTVSLVSADELQNGWTVEDRAFVKTDLEDIANRTLLTEILSSTELKKRDYLCSYSNTDTADAGQKDSCFYIRDEQDNLLGFLCIREKESNRFTVKEVLDRMLETDAEDAEPDMDHSGRISKEVNAILHQRIAEIWSRYNTPEKPMKKSDKIQFIMELMEAGIFRMKGAAVQVSEVTGISQASIYRYLGEASAE